MKVLSLKQPFTELVVSGKKTIELRKWNTKFKGDFLVHASKRPDEKAMKKFGFVKLPLGVIVGKSRLVGVKKYLNEEECEKDKNKHLADFSWGKFGFILKNSRRIHPISARGNLGFWNFNVPKNF